MKEFLMAVIFAVLFIFMIYLLIADGVREIKYVEKHCKETNLYARGNKGRSIVIYDCTGIELPKGE